MAKTPLSKTRREIILDYMMRQYDLRENPEPLASAKQIVVDGINTAIRARYPESDMAVLRRYEEATHESSFRLSVRDSGRVFGIEFSHAEASLFADLHLCRSYRVLECDAELAVACETYEKLRHDAKSRRESRQIEYRSFLNACRSVEDVEATIPLPPDVRSKIGASSSALVALNAEIIAMIKHEFAAAA